MYAQQPEQYSIAKVNIPAINIRKIEQDEKHFMWIGTQDGLFKFDSKNHIEYNTEKQPGQSINGPDIRIIVPDTLTHSLWISATEGGICQIDLNSGTVVSRLSQTDIPVWKNIVITAIQPVKDTLYIASSEGLFVVNKITHAATRFPVATSGGVYLKDIENMVVYKDHLFVFCRSRGIISINIRDKQVMDFFPVDKIVNQPVSTYLRFYQISKAGDGKWLASTSDGLKLIALENSGRIYVNKKPFEYVPFTYNIETFSVIQDKAGFIWFSTEANLFKINPYTRKYSIVEQAFSDNENNWLDNVYYLYCDEANDIWLGCQKGLAYLRNRPPAFWTYYKSKNCQNTIKHAYFLYPRTDSILYATAEDGLYKVFLKTKEIEAIDQSQSYDYIFTDANNKIITSNRKGLFILNGNKLTGIAKQYPEFRPYETFRINSAIKLNDSCMVLGTENYMGILVWNFIDHTVRNFNQYTPRITLAEGNVNNLVQISGEVFCVLSDNSFIVIDYQNKTARPVYFRNKGSDKNFSLFFDMCWMKGHYYVASYGAGVLVLDKDFKLTQTISTGVGLSNNGTYKILPWKDSLLFITTNNGLNVYDPVKKSIKVFYKSDGLHDNTFEETSGTILKDLIFAGGPNGFTALDPAYISKNNSPPHLYFSKLSIEQPGNKRSDTSNLDASSFSIASSALQTTVYFSALNYRNPDRTTFYYKISELHKDWIPLGNQNFINLIGLSAVTYHLNIKAANEDGISSEPKQLTFIFLPKWYETRAFKILIILAIIGIAYIIYTVRINQLKKEQKIRTKLASDLHDDLGGTMNSVKIYASLATMPGESNKYLSKITETVQETIISLRDMIWVLHDDKQTIEDLVMRISTFAIPLCDASNIKFKQQMTDNVRDYNLSHEERKNLYMIIKESVNNSVKYSHGSKIEIQISLIKNKPHIKVVDDGKGFDTNQVSQGYGLNNMARRAREIKYLVTIESMPGAGTIVQLVKL